jgi:hypothetical protein
MMNMKKILMYASIIVLLLSLIAYQTWGNEPKALSKEMENSLTEQMESIKQVVQTDIMTNSASYLTYPVEDSKDEFTTFYTYKTMDFFNKHPNKKVCSHYMESIDKKEFTENQDEFFTGIERMYNAVELLEQCGKTIPADKMKPVIQGLYNQSYFEEGYFLSAEFKEYRNKEGYEEVKLSQTQMMLELGDKWNIPMDDRKDPIKAWLDKFINQETDPLYIRKYLDSMESLGFKPNKDVLQQLDYSSIIEKDQYTFLDLLSIESVAYMHQKGLITLSKEEITLIFDKLSYSHTQFSDIQQEFFTVSIYDHFNLLQEYPNEDSMIRQFTRLVYQDGMLPLLSKTSNPYSPYLSMMVALEDQEDSVASIQLKKRISTIVKGAALKDLMKMDPFEVLSYIKLQKEINPSFSETELGKGLISEIKGNLSNHLDAGNIIRNSYYIHSLSLMGAPIKENDLPKNTETSLKMLGDGKTKLFTNSTDFSNLLLIYSLKESGLFKQELKNVIPYVKKIQVNLSSQVPAYELYYKTLILKEMGEETDVEDTAEKLSELHSGNGYKLNKEQKFSNFYATIFLNQLNHRMLGE